MPAGFKEIDRIGSFQAHIIEYGLKKASDSDAVAVALAAHLLAMWNPETEQWEPWDLYMMFAAGDSWIVKKDGNLNTRSCESLMKSAGWDGTLESISDKTWQPTDCQVKVGADTYKNVTRYRIEFINPFDSTPGKFEELAAEKVQGLAQRFGTQLRALAASNRANATPKPNGKPPAPPVAAKTPPPVAATAPVAPLDGDTPL